MNNKGTSCSWKTAQECLYFQFEAAILLVQERGRADNAYLNATPPKNHDAMEN